MHSAGNYSRLACEIQFVRSMGYYLIQIYIPSGLIVIISWVSFWLNRNATPARVQLGVTTVLTMTTLMSSTNAALPKISYVKSIDVYLGTCFVMVFTSLLGTPAIPFQLRLARRLIGIGSDVSRSRYLHLCRQSMRRSATCPSGSRCASRGSWRCRRFLRRRMCGPSRRLGTRTRSPR